jgi:hypothetical protein
VKGILGLGAKPDRRGASGIGVGSLSVWCYVRRSRDGGPLPGPSPLQAYHIGRPAADLVIVSRDAQFAGDVVGIDSAPAAGQAAGGAGANGVHQLDWKGDTCRCEVHREPGPVVTQRSKRSPVAEDRDGSLGKTNRLFPQSGR